MTRTTDTEPARRALRLTRLGLGAERAVRAFWPAWTAALLGVAVWSTDLLTGTAATAALAAAALATLVLLAWGLWRFRLPARADAAARLDRTLPGRPLQGLADDIAVGRDDADAHAVWRAHRDRLSRTLAAARPVSPDLRVSRRDPFALRYLALLLAAVGILFGTLLRVPDLPGIPGQSGTAQAAGPSWEGWLEPPRHTGLPGLYLRDVEPGPVTVPEGTRITVRLYAAPGAITVRQDVGDPIAEGTDAAVQQFTAERDGTLTIAGTANDPTWTLDVTPDAAPAIAMNGAPGFEHPDAGTLPWQATDDYGVAAAGVAFALDLASVDRRHGLAVDPEPRDAVTLQMPLPIAGDRADVADVFRFDLTKHPFAGLPVLATLTATDAMDQSGTTTAPMILPGRSFYDTDAAALIEMRRDLLWSRANAERTARLLRAVTWNGADAFDHPPAYLLTRTAIRRLDRAGDALSEAERDRIAEMLWKAALRLEEDSLDSALERLRQAQDRLAEAIRQGADPDEIARLMEEMRRAMDDYTRQLAERGEQDGSQAQQQAENGEMQQVTPDMLDQMMQRIEELMEQGRTAEAQELLQQLQEMMENLQVTQGQPGGGQGQQGQGGPGEQAMDEMRDTLREQQGLSDDAFRELQERFDPNAQAGESQENEGRNGGQGRGQEHEGQAGEGQAGDGSQGQPRPGQTPGELARRQGDLRERLDDLDGQIPGNEAGDAARDALGRAGRAMEQARRDLEDGNLGGALNDQAQAMDALRDGMQELGRALSDQQPGGGQPGDRDTAGLRPGEGGQRDPLGRRSGDGARLGTDEQFLDGPDAARRSQELRDEIRRRSAEQSRPELERDYLNRLLDRF
ncbi:DUF4175 domain-containing protein [Jannaschia sp. LMIT008]|uniref:DUF4175 domain-containing protein n=1 Tax=Jannaschia maritima TaxID=3032585 RepID=UPI002811BB81|nr:DUF4175 family protein [Jannaschia sp. LMIT008]